MTSANQLPDQATGLRIAAASYPDPDPDQTRPVDEQIPSAWADVTKVVGYFGAGYNTQYKPNPDGTPSTTLENQFVIEVNSDTKQIVISFKGSDALSNWKSDLSNGGGSEYLKIVQQAQDAYNTLKADSTFAGYTFSTTGHSLGGSMAQMFALKNGLDTQVYNSLALAQSIIASGYFGSTDIAAVIASYQAAGHVVSDVRTPNDIATYFYQAPVCGPYVILPFSKRDQK
jgi:hypothetical protein